MKKLMFVFLMGCVLGTSMAYAGNDDGGVGSRGGAGIRICFGFTHPAGAFLIGATRVFEATVDGMHFARRMI